MDNRKKIIIALGALIFLFAPLLSDLEPYNTNLQGLNFARLRCEFNGVPFFKAYENTKEQNPMEFNLEAVESKLKEDGIPIDKGNIRSIHNQMKALLQETGIRVVELKTVGGKPGSTILPTINIGVEVMEAPGKMFFCLVYITVSKWMSTWSETGNIRHLMIAWWQKKMMAAPPDELITTIEKTVKELIDDFNSQLKTANPPEEEQKTDDSASVEQ